MASEFDSTKLPTGAMGWRSLIDWAVEVGDDAESFWLEIKSDVDPFSKIGAAKVAKFILGMANRMPVDAATAVGGHGIMLLGVKQGSTEGVRPIEGHELAGKLRRFLGDDGPGWDIQTVNGEGDNKVLIVIADPPKDGDQIHVCQGEGDDLLDGGIYVRHRTQTRPANSGDLRKLKERETSVASSVELEVAVVGEVRAYLCDSNVAEEYISGTVRSLLRALPSEQKSNLPTSYQTLIQRAAAVQLPVMNAMTTPEHRTEDEFRAEVAEYVEQCEAAVPEMIDASIGAHATPVTFRVRNQTSTFLKDMQLKVHLEGPVDRVFATDGRSFDPKRELPETPEVFGPKKADFLKSLDYIPMRISPTDYSSLRPMGGPSADYHNSGSVTANLELPELRPEATHDFEPEIVLVVRDPDLRSISGIWVATAGDIHAVFRGSFTIDVLPPIDITEHVRSKFREVANGGTGAVVYPSGD